MAVDMLYNLRILFARGRTRVMPWGVRRVHLRDRCSMAHEDKKVAGTWARSRWSLKWGKLAAKTGRIVVKVRKMSSRSAPSTPCLGTVDEGVGNKGRRPGGNGKKNGSPSEAA
jgi:hypothetical protein